MGVNGEVTLNGTLSCTTQAELALVWGAVQTHIDLTRAEDGCLSFEVLQSDDPMVWTVSERFIDAEAFQAHQTRAGASEWSKLTQGIARDYKITGLE